MGETPRTRSRVDPARGPHPGLSAPRHRPCPHYLGAVAPRSPLVLAALASVAVPGLEPRTARALPGSEEVDAAEVVDELGREWVVRAPRTPAAAALLEQEWRVLGTDPRGGAVAAAPPPRPPPP